MLNFDLTSEQQLLEQSVREWGAREIAPHIKEDDRQHRFDRLAAISRSAFAKRPVPTFLLGRLQEQLLQRCRTSVPVMVMCYRAVWELGRKHYALTRKVAPFR